MWIFVWRSKVVLRSGRTFDRLAAAATCRSAAWAKADVRSVRTSIENVRISGVGFQVLRYGYEQTHSRNNYRFLGNVCPNDFAIQPVGLEQHDRRSGSWQESRDGFIQFELEHRC